MSSSVSSNEINDNFTLNQLGAHKRQKKARDDVCARDLSSPSEDEEESEEEYFKEPYYPDSDDSNFGISSSSDEGDEDSDDSSEVELMEPPRLRSRQPLRARPKGRKKSRRRRKRPVSYHCCVHLSDEMNDLKNC